MVSFEHLSRQTTEVVETYKTAVANADARTLEIAQRLDDEHGLMYMLAGSEAQRMAIHDTYWSQKFSGAGSAMALTSLVPVAGLAVLSAHPGMGVGVADWAAVGGMSMVLAGVGAVTRLAANKAADIAARWVESRAAKYAAPAHTDWSPAAASQQASVDAVAKSLGGAAAGFAGLSQKIKTANPEERAVFNAVGRLISAKVSAQMGGAADGEAVDRRLDEVAKMLRVLQKSNPAAAAEVSAGVERALNAYDLSLRAVDAELSVSRVPAPAVKLG